MKVLAFDTETTGIPRGTDYTDADNPYLASITGILYDTETKRIEQSMNLAILPEGWTMPPAAGVVNGLTTEYLDSNGIPLASALAVFFHLVGRADIVVAHNSAFDKKIMSIALWRYGLMHGDTPADIHLIVKAWQNHNHYCTMEAAKPIVKALNKKGGLKYPKLAEAYQHFFDKELTNAHSANADTVACLEIYLALQET